ncbi:hypothetical protein [Calidifontibacillus oryziterrae]|uniref:hypothetical protein n=1 Tax=Calidifontibacillus oryziterrae TaxID=1191699 RepID=UPI000371F1E9|nr:hypothetical protein [Calidifontibacillus oryziterrae]
MVRFSLILSLCFLYILQSFIKSDGLIIVFDIVAVMVYLFLFPLLDHKQKKFTLTLFLTGIVIHFFVGDSGIALFQGITQNMALLAILVLAPLLSVPLKREGVMDTVVFYLNGLKNNPRNIFYGISSFMLILAPILNMGALRIVHGFVEKIKITPNILSNSYYYGFTPAVMWSPFFASVGIVVYYLDITYISYVAVGAIFALIQIAIGYSILRPRSFENSNNVTGREQEVPLNIHQKKHLSLLIVFVFGLVALLIVLEQLTNKSMLLLVSVVCLIIPIIWVLLRKRTNVIMEEVAQYKDRVIMQKTEICLFLSAGLFGNAISHTPIKGHLEQIMQWSATKSVGILFLFIIVFVTLMAFLGVHQIIVIPLIITSLNLSEIHISAVIIAFMCIFTWMLSSAISPLNAMNIIISQCVRKNGLTVAFRWNGKYFLTLTGMAFLYVYIVSWVGI